MTQNPEELAQRIERLEARDEIRMLAHRYALAVDTKNLDALMSLFVEDVQVGKNARGRDALRQWYTPVLAKFRSSIHQVSNHIIELKDAHNASGVVYCRDELEQDDGQWHVGVIQYWDDYQRQDGRWLFRRRKLHRWYLVDALTRPGRHITTDERAGMPQPWLPDAWPSWGQFWEAWDTAGGGKA